MHDSFIIFFHRPEGSLLLLLLLFWHMAQSYPDIEDLIMAGFSESHTLFLAQVAIEKPDFLSQLIQLTFSNIDPLSKRAAWPLRKVFDSHAQLIRPYLDTFVERLPEIQLESVMRTICSILARTEIPEKHHGFLIGFCSEKILHGNTSIAVLANCMDIFYQIARNEPALVRELELMFEIITPTASAGIKSKMNIIRRKVKKATSGKS